MDCVGAGIGWGWDSGGTPAMELGRMGGNYSCPVLLLLPPPQQNPAPAQPRWLRSSVTAEKAAVAGKGLGQGIGGWGGEGRAGGGTASEQEGEGRRIFTYFRNF